MNQSSLKPEGWLESLRRIGSSLVSLIRTRLELFTIELQEEKLRLLNLAIWLFVAASVALAGILIGLAALAYWLWTVAGYLGLIGLAFAALLVATLIVLAVRQKIKSGPTPFAQTVAEFRKDGDSFKQP